MRKQIIVASCVLAWAVAPTLRSVDVSEDTAPFSVSEGADVHCEPKGYGLRELRVFISLDNTMG